MLKFVKITNGISPTKSSLDIPRLSFLSAHDSLCSLTQVPILGSASVDVRSTSGSGFVRRADVAPLAGTMEDPGGRGLVPIEIGAPALDPVTGQFHYDSISLLIHFRYQFILLLFR